MAENVGVSEYVSGQLSEIAKQLGQMSTSVEGLREDLKDESHATKAHQTNIIARVDNIAERMAKAEEAIADTKAVIDNDVMPLIKANTERRLMFTGALRFWGALVAVVSAVSAVFWTKVLEILAALFGYGPQ